MPKPAMEEPTAMDLRAMTIGPFLELLYKDPGENRGEVDYILFQTLPEVADAYHDWGGDIQCDALRLAAETLNEDGVDETTATFMVHAMATLAAYMLQEEGARQWPAETRSALRKIKGSNR
jgi:hypothetical protein